MHSLIKQLHYTKMLQLGTQNIIHFKIQLKRNGSLCYYQYQTKAGSKSNKNIMQRTEQIKAALHSLTLLMLEGEEKTPLPLHRSSGEEW